MTEKFLSSEANANAMSLEKAGLYIKYIIVIHKFTFIMEILGQAQWR